MKYLVRILVSLFLISTNTFAQYLETELTEADLDPKPIIQDHGFAPKDEKQLIVDESRRESKEGTNRAPAVINEETIINKAK